jgi:uncharacterized iron-regulated membrane protein
MWPGMANPRRVRTVAIVVHRWVGLVMAAFLFIAGVTGSVLAFYVDLDAALNPELRRTKAPVDGRPPLEPLDLHARIQKQQRPDVVLDTVVLERRPTETVNYWIDERETFFDPYTGQLLGSRKFGDLGEGKKNLLTFIYRFHYSLSLSEVGTVIFGIVAILWFLDCFVGAYLTFPPRATRGEGEPAPEKKKRWLARWLPSWLLRANKLFSLVFTWHRASGLWVWGLFLVFAWSAVALNLGEQVYKPVMDRLLPEPSHVERPALAQPRKSPKLDLRAARERGRQLMRAEEGTRQFHVIGERWLSYDDKHGTYAYTVESTLDVDERLADTSVTFDGDDGTLVSFHGSTGQSARGTFDSWIIALHFAAVRPLGVAYRVFVCVFGTVVAGLCVTGVWIWWRKRKARRRLTASVPVL